MRFLAAGFVLLTAAPALAQDETIGVRIREWYAALNGDLQVEDESFGVPATTIDLDSELGLDDSEFAHELQGYLALPVIGKFYLGVWTGAFEGDETVSRDITFEDLTFTAGTTVKSELDLTVGYLTYEFTFPTIPLGDVIQFELGLQAGIRGLYAEGSIESPAIGSESDEAGGGLPVVGVHGALAFTEWLRTDVELVGLTFQYGDTSATYFEAYAEIVVTPLPWLFAGVGYKYVLVELADETSSTEFDLDISLDGVYLTAGVRF